MLYICLVFNCFVCFSIYCEKVEYMKLLKNQSKVYQNTIMRPVLLILSALLSQLSDGGIGSRYNKSEDTLILTVPAKYSDI